MCVFQAKLRAVCTSSTMSSSVSHENTQLLFNAVSDVAHRAEYNCSAHARQSLTIQSIRGNAFYYQRW